MTPIEKITADLKGDNEKVIILALMHIPRLAPRQNVRHLEEMEHWVRKQMSGGHPDITFLGRKALNWIQQHAPQASAPVSDPVPEEKPVDEFSDLSWLGQVDSNETDLKRIEDYLRSESERIVASAIEAYSKCASIKDQRRLLVPFLSAENNRIKANAIVAVGSFSLVDVLPHLEGMLNTTRISMRESAVFALSALPAESEVRDLLIRCLHDPYRDIRLRALKGLDGHQGRELELQLRRLSDDEDIEIAEQASRLLSQISATEVDSTLEEPDFTLPQPVEITKKTKEDDYDEFIDADEAFISVEPLDNSIELQSSLLAQNEPQVASVDDGAPLFAMDSETFTGIPDLFALDSESPAEAPATESEPEPEVEPEVAFSDWDTGSDTLEESFPDPFQDSIKAPDEPEPEPEPVPVQDEVLLPDNSPSQILIRLKDYLDHISWVPQPLDEQFFDWIPQPQITMPLLEFLEDQREFIYAQHWLPLAPVLKPQIQVAPVPEPVSVPEPVPAPISAPEPVPERLSKPEPQTVQKTVLSREELEQAAQELLRQTGADLFQYFQANPVLNYQVQQAYREVISAQDTLKDYYARERPATREQMMHVRKLQAKVRKTFIQLARTALVEVRGKRFQFENAQRIQAQLAELVKHLQSAT